LWRKAVLPQKGAQALAERFLRHQNNYGGPVFDRRLTCNSLIHKNIFPPVGMAGNLWANRPAPVNKSPAIRVSRGRESETVMKEESMSETFLDEYSCKFQANSGTGFLRGRDQYFIKISFGIRLGMKSTLRQSPSIDLKKRVFDNRLLFLIYTDFYWSLAP
jgi:hypothetical protein